MIILDTNVLSEVIRREPDESVLMWLDSLPAEEVATTAITAAELLHGVARLPDGHRKTALTEAVNAVVHNDFHGRVESFDMLAANEYAAIVSRRDMAGRPITMADAQIAAICRSRHATLATRNTKDFLNTGVELVDPWRLT
ncbi:type II toxin-antitoxin system VapC family toxin [Kibdelosporangium persicum]|uniref:Ribonuclease VapC n=1 Tax=Kibdelosporangium persicum TaxID=2698649 RepID=A0ABX2F918_9PSEU|nr:type II toxin-antitoxin system VapC family toxin [Kibdelosporangium persicum]NRN67849.1 Ribonuclease VapC [Kibdelosporangium persicum]